MNIKKVCQYCSENCAFHEGNEDCPIYCTINKQKLISLLIDKIIIDGLVPATVDKDNYESLIKQGIQNYINNNIPYNENGTKVELTLSQVIDELFENLEIDE